MQRTQQQWLTALAVCVGGVMSAIDTFILYVATPHLRGVFSATVAEVSSISTSYATASMLCMLMSAGFVQRYGAKRTYLSGLSLFLLGSLLCGTARSLDFLIFARALQGMGAGILLPVEGVILRRTFPPQQHGLVLGLYGSSVMCGPAFGPMLGGLIIEHFSWEFMFLVNLPIGLAGMIMVRRFVPAESGDPAQAKPFDLAGFLLLGTGVICLISLLERGNRTFWFDDMHNILLLAGCLVSWAMFAAHLKMRAIPMLDLSVLSNRSFSAANTVNFLAAFMITGALFILPIFMQELLRFSPVEAGTSMAPRAFVMMFAFPFVGVLFNRIGPRLLITCGICLGFISAVLMSQLTAEAGWGDMILPQIIQGLSAAFVLGPVTTAALMQMSKEKMPGAAAIEATTRLLGSTLGVAVFASLLTHYEAVMWELVRHQISMSNLILYKRFKGLLYFFHTDSAPEALQKAYQMLNGRVTIQVMSLAYMNLFQLACAGFLLMLLISFFVKLKKVPN